MNIDLLLNGLLQGLILAILAYSVMLPFRIINFPDISVEGSYPLGAVLCCALLLLNIPPIIATSIAMIGAGFIGVATGYIHLKLKVNTLLAGIILSTMAYSVNLRILGKPNAAIFEAQSLLTASTLINAAILTIIVIIIWLLLGLFLHTDKGLILRAIGFNKEFAQRQNIKINNYILWGLFCSGCLSGLAGCLMINIQYYADVGMGVGIIIHALAALMLGESIVGNTSIKQQIFAPIIGALLYQQIQGIALNSLLAPSDLKLFTGLTVLAIISLRSYKTKKYGLSTD